MAKKEEKVKVAMATITVTIPNDKIPRILAAFGHGSPVDSKLWVNATPLEMQDWLYDQLKQRVLDYENTKAANDDRVTRQTELKGW